MDFNTYQKKALESIALKQRGTAALAHRSLGLSGEAGIVANEIKKAIRDKGGRLDPEDINCLKEKLGDILYYVAALTDYIGCDLSEIAAQNLQKSDTFKKRRDAQK